MSLAEARHSGEFILSMAHGNRSVDNGTLLSGQNLVAGAVLGKITATGKWKVYDNAASDGSQSAAGILMAATNASSADTACAVLVRDAEVIYGALTWGAGSPTIDTPAGIVDLALLHVIVRS
jgi:hypothetical protein